MNIGINSKRDYTFDRRLGEGGFGTVSCVRRKSDGALFAEKVIKLPTNVNQQSRRSAMDEVTIAIKLQHPNIVRMFTSFTDDDSLIIIMEFCEEGDLADEIARRMPPRIQHFQEAKIRLWMNQLAHAVLYLHEKKIIHRDIKPMNVFLSSGGQVVKLGDFGIAKMLDSSFAQANTMAGTISYLAPEICRGEAYDTKVDIWSLGLVLYEMASFKTAFTDDNPFAFMKKIQTAQPAPIDDGTYSKNLYALIDKMLTKDSQMRPSISDVLNDAFLIAVPSKHSSPSSSVVVEELELDTIKKARSLPSDYKDGLLEVMRERRIKASSLLEYSEDDIERLFPDQPGMSRAVASFVSTERRSRGLSGNSSASALRGLPRSGNVSAYPVHNSQPNPLRKANSEAMKHCKSIPPGYRDAILDVMDENKLTVDRLVAVSSRTLQSLFPQDNIRKAVQNFIHEVTKKDTPPPRYEAPVDELYRQFSNNQDIRSVPSDMKRPTKRAPGNHEPPDPSIQNDNRLPNNSVKLSNPTPSSRESLNRIK